MDHRTLEAVHTGDSRVREAGIVRKPLAERRDVAGMDALAIEIATGSVEVRAERVVEVVV